MNDAEHPDEPSSANDSEPGHKPGRATGVLVELPQDRPAGSVAEEHAGRRLMQAFHSAAIPATSLNSRVPVLQSYAELLTIPMLLLGILLGAFVPVLGVFALMLTVALYAAEAAGEGWIARIVPSQSCNSILAAVPAHRRELRRVVVVAAMDSHGTGVLDRGPVAFIGRHVSRLIVLCGLVAVVLLAIQALASPPPPDSILIVPAIALLTLLALVAEPTLRRSPAERDDASAELLQSIVELGATLRAQPARWVDVWCFVAGGGSVSGEALRQFIQDNQFSRETTYFINLIPDADTVTFALAEGALWKRRSAPVLVRILAAASGARPNSRLARNTQCAVAIGMGYQALTIGIPASHDVQDNLDGTDSTSLLAAAMSAIDHDLVERNRVARLARPAQSRPTRPIRPPQT